MSRFAQVLLVVLTLLVLAWTIFVLSTETGRKMQKMFDRPEPQPVIPRWY